MAIPETVSHFLSQKDTAFDVVSHPRTFTSSRTAQAAHVTGERVAKGVVVKDETSYLLAVIPATHSLKLGLLRRQLDRQLGLATEDELTELFPDCAVGAVPALGPAYGLETVVDEALRNQPEIYFEAGNHEELIRVSEPDFENLLGDVEYGEFSVHQP